MQLHLIRSELKRKRKKRIGRGGKRGTYSGRGQKGQKSRSGHRIRPAERDLIMRIPKLRGVKNKSRKPAAISLNVGDLEKAIQGSMITNATLREAGYAKPGTHVKILGGGTLTRPFTVKGVKVSASAKKKIEAAGGSVGKASK